MISPTNTWDMSIKLARHENVPAYFADKMDALTDGNPANDHKNFGGAKFFLAKASYVPMKGLIVEADYGFNAKDMGGKKWIICSC